MTFNYDKARETAAKIINKYGALGSLIKKGSEAGDFDENGDPVTPTPDSIINGIITPIVKYKNHEIDGKSIVNGDGWVFFHSDSEPEIDMQATVNGKTFRVISIDKLSSPDNDVVIYYKLQLRIG